MNWSLLLPTPMTVTALPALGGKKPNAFICCKKTSPNHTDLSPTSRTQLKITLNSFVRTAQTFYANHCTPQQSHRCTDLSFRVPNDSDDSNHTPWRRKRGLESWTRFCSGHHKHAAKSPLIITSVATSRTVLQRWTLSEVLGRSSNHTVRLYKGHGDFPPKRCVQQGNVHNSTFLPKKPRNIQPNGKRKFHSSSDCDS